MNNAVSGPASRDRGNPIFSLRDISKHFNAVQALSHVDLDIHAGEVVALVGDNGSGKSTLVKILAGVYQPDGGTISHQGTTITLPSPSAAQHAGIATVFQDLALTDNLTIVNNLFLGREVTRGGLLNEHEMEQQATTLLRRLKARMPSIRTPVAHLSGGQKQSVAIARTLLGNPQMILLDEPTSALSVTQSAEVLTLIESLRERGLGVVIVSHNLAEVQAVADRIMVLRLGRNIGTFHTRDVSYEQIVSLITGATDRLDLPTANPHRAEPRE
ncbi:ATP-binding cassette domain-containing protein [Jonesia denitrificans]|uniref:ABC transporter related n=1 Tax=Jonesia denitrificans (strain ATCC 14870 / DSM 20603 / BCRC 15368 / CIP 55.134 / JCM 11481 / NBRC 15587 / NCTC 10816 / Prevot 55134) TaxID=471856 RepID=C7R1E1_JONDD|nr:ATP-binding cassette domain-containing protein [Jonesia denitrificans]ACV08356.1 ABC transporter related [Jonesia denitrificans DSM 20603]ASE07986.1 sugar ABC transporter ATP-binding protein [Jonesia denitrificans]QXB42593.1 ATP-binding cassette domain-containing protein [Jonesia denitrificans]SQH20336.1 Arabinose import ATP-binding protein AraG [Jonesia denitrificans]